MAKLNNTNNMSRDMTKTNKMSVRPAKTQISLGIRPVWSESSLSAWRNLGSLATKWAHIYRLLRENRSPFKIFLTIKNFLKV